MRADRAGAVDRRRWWRSVRPAARSGRSDDDPTLRALVEAGTSTVCIVGKSWDFHVTEALRTTLDEGVAMVGESVRFLAAEGLRVFFDAEHFFDGYKRPTPSTRRACSRPPRPRVRTAWCCATPTAARCRTRSSGSSVRSSATSTA